MQEERCGVHCSTLWSWCTAGISDESRNSSGNHFWRLWFTCVWMQEGISLTTTCQDSMIFKGVHLPLWFFVPNFISVIWMSQAWFKLAEQLDISLLLVLFIQRKGYVALAMHGRVALILRMNGSDRTWCKVLMFPPIYHVSSSPTHGNGPNQGQRKTLTRVGFEPTTFEFDHRCSTDWATRPDGSRLWDMKMLMARQWICRYKERLRCISNAWPCSTYIKNEW